MTARFRSRTVGGNAAGSHLVSFFFGPYSDYYGGYFPKYRAAMREAMNDHTSPYPHVDQTLSFVKSVVKPLRLNGETPMNAGYQKFKYENFCPDNYLSTESYYLPEPTIGFPSAFLLTKALARLNPNVPGVDLPLFLFELKDFPSMLRNLGDILTKKIPADLFPYGYLAYQFGWKPLISDLIELASFGNGVSNKIRKFRKLRDGGRVGGRLGGASLIHDSGSPWIWYTDGTKPLYGVKTDSEVSEWWFSAHLSPDPDFVFPDPEAERWAAVKAHLGLNVSAATLWNMVPWSFLVDYFLNISDFLNATRGGWLPFHVSRMNIMCKEVRTRSVTFDGSPAPGTSVSGTSGYSTSSRLSRSVPTLAIPVLAPKPFLSNVQVANIGALITAGALRAFR